MEKIVNRLAAVAAVCAVVFGALAYFYRDAEHDSAAEGDVMLSVCDYVEIDFERLDVEIIPYDGEYIRVKYRSRLPLIIEYGDNSVSISEDERFVISLFSETQSLFGVCVYLPERSYREISVYTGTGSVTTGRIDSRLLNIITESGDITCTDTVSQFNISTTSGSAFIDIEAVMKDCSVLSRNGDVDILVSESASVAVEFETQTGQCIPEITGGRSGASGTYGINGGSRVIYAAVPEGTLTIKKR